MSDSLLRVNGRMHFRHVINRSKIMLEEQGEVRLEGVGISTSSLSVATERLVTLGYATLESINSELLTEDRRAVKLVAHLKKASTFDQAIEEFRKKRESEEVKDEAEAWT